LIKENQLNPYSEFVNILDLSLKTFVPKPSTEWKITATKYVDGHAAHELRRLVDLDVRREFGIFFTDSKLAMKVLDHLKPDFNNKSVIYDPACGAGNLLISAYNYMKIRGIVVKNKNTFLGTDIHKELVDAASLRLQINQLINSGNSTSKAINRSPFKLISGDGLKQNSCYRQATHVLVNPPFNLVEAGEKILWSKGKVSAAALFIDRIVENIDSGTSIYAILPDVLRSGSRYQKWREIIFSKCKVIKSILLGQFDKFTDVDVFAIHLVKHEPLATPAAIRISVKQNSQKTIDSLFDVCVGSVVDNRDPELGPQRKYIVSKGLKGWSILKNTKRKRKHSGKSFQGPFVVIKRTSRKGDQQRAVATVIHMTSPVYVDNHLIVLKPKTGTLKECRKILNTLKSEKTDRWLNKKIRCRHLTVKIVSKIPIWQ
jgi:hypothetical protein